MFFLHAPIRRGETEVPAQPKTARDSDTAAWVSAGLEERQSEDLAADRTSAEVDLCSEPDLRWVQRVSMCAKSGSSGVCRPGGVPAWGFRR